jgi:hypothetical protein
MVSQVQFYNVSQAFCPLELTVRDTASTKPTIQGVLEYAYVNSTTVASAIWDDPNTASACVSQGMIAGWVAGYKTRNTNSVIQAIAVPAAGLTVAALRYGAGKAGTALRDAASQSATNGWIRDVLDYAYDNPITTAVSAIAGIAGSVLGPLYSQAAIDAFVLNERMTAIHNTALLNNGLGITLQMLNDVDAAYDNSCYDVILRQNLGRSFISGLGAAIVPHVLNYVGKTISNSCTDQDGYCSRGMAAISNIRIGL